MIVWIGSEYQSEVALLSRRIVLKGQQTNDNFGGHTRVFGVNAQGRFSGVQGENMGNTTIKHLTAMPYTSHDVR